MILIYVKPIVDIIIKLLIVAGGITVGVLDLWYYCKYKEDAWKWIKLIYSFIGMYWAGLYFYLALFPLAQNTLVFAQIFIRLPLLFTLATMTAGAIIRHRSKLPTKRIKK